MAIKLKTLLNTSILISPTGSYNYFPRLLSIGSSNCIISWTNIGSNNIHNVNLRKFDCSSLTLGNIFTLSPCFSWPFNQNNLFNATLAEYAAGQYIVSWTQTGAGFSGARNFASDNVCLQLYQGESALSSSIDIDSTNTYYQFDSEVASLDSSSAVLTYSISSNNNYNSIIGQAVIISGSGTKSLTENKKINFDFIAGTARLSSSVIKISSNKLAVSWLESNNNAVSSDVKIQLFQKNSNNDFTNLSAGAIKLNAAGSSNCFSYSTAIAANGNIFTAWTADPTNNGTRAIYGQALSSTGAKLGSVLQISPIDSARQFSPKVISLPGNNFLVSWLADGISRGIYAQEVSINGKVNRIAKIISDINLDQSSFDVLYISENNILYAWQNANGNQIRIASAKLNYFVTPSASFTATGSLSSSVTLSTTDSETSSEEVSISDSISSSLSVTQSQSESNSVSSSSTLSETSSSSITISESLSNSATETVSPSASLSSTLSGTLSATSSNSISDTISNSETTTLTGSFSDTKTASLSATGSLSDLTISQSSTGTFSETGTNSDSVSKTITVTTSPSMSDGTDSLSQTNTATITSSDSTSVSLSVLTQTITESLTQNTESISGTVTISQSPSESSTKNSESISTSFSESLSNSLLCQSNQVRSVHIHYINLDLTSIATKSFSDLKTYNLTASTKLINTCNKEAKFKADLTIDFQNFDEMSSFVQDTLILRNHHVLNGTVTYNRDCKNDFVLNEIYSKKLEYQTEPVYSYSWYHPDSVRTYCLSPWKAGRIEEKVELMIGPNQCATAKMTASFYKDYALNYKAQAVLSAIDKYGNRIVDQALITAAKCIFNHQNWDLINNNTEVLSESIGVITHDYLYNIDVDVMRC